MIDISGHIRPTRREIGFEDHSRPLMVNCCGYQAFMTRDSSRQRPAGRLDYQLIYLHKGYGHYLQKGQWQTHGPGTLVLYRPEEPQSYSYLGKDRPEVFWVHFTGLACEELLNHYQIGTGYIGESLQLKNLFQEIILELQLKKPFCQDVVISDFYRLLALIGRVREETARNQKEYSPMIDQLIIHLNQHYRNAWTVSAMAEYCHLSADYFAHSFRKRTGAAPMQYLNELRIEKARELLENQELSIAAIGALTGYEDPLYFSRVFRKITGCSPRAYRKGAAHASGSP